MTARLEDAVANTADVVIANDNSDAQVVLSGSKEGVDAVVAAVTCKRAVPLAVSGAFHSPSWLNRPPPSPSSSMA